LPVEGTVQPPDVNVFSAFAAKPLMWVSLRMSTGILGAGAAGVVGAAGELLAAGGVAGAVDAAGAAVLDARAGDVLGEGLADADRWVADADG
jgi:hypothetical protein